MILSSLLSSFTFKQKNASQYSTINSHSYFICTKSCFVTKYRILYQFLLFRLNLQFLENETKFIKNSTTAIYHSSIFALTATEIFISPNDVATCSELGASSLDADGSRCSDAYAFPPTFESFGGDGSFRAAAAADSKNKLLNARSDQNDAKTRYK